MVSTTLPSLRSDGRQGMFWPPGLRRGESFYFCVGYVFFLAATAGVTCQRLKQDGWYSIATFVSFAVVPFSPGR